MRSSTYKRGTRDQQSRLRGLASEHGYEAVEALRSDGWYLLTANGEKVSDQGRTTFTVLQALEWLRQRST